MKKKFLIPGLSTKAKVWATILACFSVTLAILGTLVGVCTDWQMLADEMKAGDYTPSDGIVEITDNLRLTRKGKSIFYATHPQLQKNATFNRGCGSDGEGTYTLGCYWKDQDEDEKEHIALYNTGVNELRERDVVYNFVAERNTTALHEMLHAVYDRLSEKDKIIACTSAHTIVKEISSLKKSLEIYPKNQYCSEAYARIGSEYIISLSGYKYKTSFTAREDVSDKAKLAADILSNHYKKYFSYNYELAEAHYRNQVTETALVLHIARMADALAAEKKYVLALIDGYYYYPTLARYYTANAAVETYNDHLAIYKSYYSIYAKIHAIINSETSSSLASL